MIVIIEQVVTNIDKIDHDVLHKCHLEKVYLESADLLKRVQRVVTDHGREIGIRLKEQKELSAGDVLYMDEHNIVAIDVVSEDLLIIRPKSLQEMGTIAHKIGNRHLPAQFEGDEMLVQYDYLVEELLKECRISYSRESRKVKQPFRHVGHSHG